MKKQGIKTKVVHSQTKSAWNVVCVSPIGAKYKIARIPYDVVNGDEILSTMQRKEALEHAEFISYCFNNSETICACPAVLPKPYVRVIT